MTTFTASEVREHAELMRTSIHNLDPHTPVMLHAFADHLEADEGAVPVYQHRYKNGSRIQWVDCDAETYELMECNEHDRKHFDRRILYTHPAPADAERLADQHDDAFQQAVQEARRVWMDEFPCEAGHDHVTPFDQFLYGNRPCMEAQPPAASVQDVSDKYHELLSAVQKKFPNESRHATALRYIQQTELATRGPTADSQENPND